MDFFKHFFFRNKVPIETRAEKRRQAGRDFVISERKRGTSEEELRIMLSGPDSNEFEQGMKDILNEKHNL